MWFFLQFLKGIRCCLSPKVKAKVWFLKTNQFSGKQAEATPYIALQDMKLEPWKYEKKHWYITIPGNSERRLYFYVSHPYGVLKPPPCVWRCVCVWNNVYEIIIIFCLLLCGFEINNPTLWLCPCECAYCIWCCWCMSKGCSPGLLKNVTLCSICREYLAKPTRNQIRLRNKTQLSKLLLYEDVLDMGRNWEENCVTRKMHLISSAPVKHPDNLKSTVCGKGT